MVKPICNVAECGKVSSSVGMCNAHYQRWYKYGDATYVARIRQDHCQVEGCEKASRSAYAGICNMHYHRLRRSGTLEANTWHRRGVCAATDCEKPEGRDGLCDMHWSRLDRTGTLAGIRPRRGGLCGIPDCDEPHDSRSLCKKHARRLRHNGDPETVRRTQPPVGPDSQWWRGDDIGYAGAHERVIKQRGRGRDHACVDCGGPARDWSYDHADPNEKRCESGPFSLDIGHYHPRCKPCHIAFDFAFTGRAAGSRKAR